MLSSPPSSTNLGKRADVKAVVLISGKPDGFIAGANIEVLQGVKTAADAEKMFRAARRLLDRARAVSQPVIAAIHGAALGGGLEWALACTYRIATDDKKTALGLRRFSWGSSRERAEPEAARLIGPKAALDLILAGKTIKAAKALKLGIVDEVVPPSILKDVAVRRAHELGEGLARFPQGAGHSKRSGTRGAGQAPPAAHERRPLGGRGPRGHPLGQRVLFSQARKALLSKTGGHYPRRRRRSRPSASASRRG